MSLTNEPNPEYWQDRALDAEAKLRSDYTPPTAEPNEDGEHYWKRRALAAETAG